MIANLTGREALPCAVALGKKAAGGFPTEKDRFHILIGRALEEDRGGRKVEVRPPHPDFAAFNAAPKEQRKSIPCVVAHLHAPDCISLQHLAYRLPRNSHPKRLPVCTGDGVVAKRWNGSTFDTIRCPGFECEFKREVEANGKKWPAPCKAQSKLVLRFNWRRLPEGHPFRNLPEMPFKFVSGGVNTATYIQGFLDAIERACAGFGIDFSLLPLFGLPVRLEMHEQKGPEQRFPVASLVIDGGDPIAWIAAQLERREHVARLAGVDTMAPLALTGPVMQSGDEAADDVEIISAGVPSRAG